MLFTKLPPNLKPEIKADARRLLEAFVKLNLFPRQAPSRIKKLDPNVIRKFQKANNLDATGDVDDKTVVAINRSLHDRFITAKQYRVRRLHSLLEVVGNKVGKAEVLKSAVGDSTRKQIKEFQKRFGLPQDGKVSEEFLLKLYDVSITKRLEGSKTQRRLLQAALAKVGKIAKLELKIAPAEAKDSVLGESTRALIEAVQKKYNLQSTGVIDKATYDKIVSVAASKGRHVQILRKPLSNELTPIGKALRVNKVSPEVNLAQKALAFLGYRIAEAEFNMQMFGATTRKAVVAFQKKHALRETGHLERNELKLLNKAITDFNPSAQSASHKPRVRGSVRNELWQPESGKVIKIYEKLLDGRSGQALATKKILKSGFFDITYDAPRTATGELKREYHLLIELHDVVDNDPANDVLIRSVVHYNVNRIQWANFTEGDARYAGTSEFESLRHILLAAIGNTEIKDLHETPNEKQITQLAIQTGLSTADIMRLVLSYTIAHQINKLDPLSAEVFYAFLRQSFPPSVPQDLLRASNDWGDINALVETASSGIVLGEEGIQKQILENALSENLVSREVKIKLNAILAELKQLRIGFTLEKPILTGDQNLKALLTNTAIVQEHYNLVAEAFISQKGITVGFWDTLKAQSAVLGANAVAELASVIELGHITRNHLPLLLFMKGKIGNDARFPSARSFAKLDKEGIIDLINQEGKNVPAEIAGNTIDERVATYASAVKKRMEVLFPSVSLIGEIKRSNTPKITRFNEVEKFIEDHADIDFVQQNIDKYILEKNLNIHDRTRDEIKMVQRVHKLTLNPLVGSLLVDAGLHSSTQIYFKGKKHIADLLEKKGVSRQEAERLYEAVRTRYFQILARLLEFAPAANTGTPAAITSPTFSSSQITAALGNMANLETLFGSLDYCDCEHCKSLYGPAAYLTDMLRFLDEHDSLITQGANTLTVKEILFERRPDIGNIKLNCENTNTSLPYIDLVCEILENNITPSQPDFANQTTLTAKELRAVPEHVRLSAYQTLAASEFPMHSSFNLFQEETRAYLKFLGVPWYELMEVFQRQTTPQGSPDNQAIAAEYFGMSSLEKTLITTSAPNALDQVRYWQFDATQAKVAVKDFMDRSKLTYNELLELLLVKFVNAPGVNRSVIERPEDTCNTGSQQINNLTLAKFDLMHRFIRLWRKTGWAMWELDLLIRNSKIGNGAIDAAALINLKHFKELQEKLRLPVERLLTFYGEINREMRVRADKPTVAVKPLYENLFQNISVTNPLDPHFAAILPNGNLQALDATIVFGPNAGPPHNGYSPVPTMLAALAVTEDDLNRLKAKTAQQLSVDALSILYRYVNLARGLRLSIKDLLLLLAVTDTADPFATVKSTVDLLKNFELMKSSDLSLLELDYVLNYSPDSSIGVRDEVITQWIGSLQKILSDNKELVDTLKLSDADRDTVLLFDAAALLPMADAAILAALAPLQAVLGAHKTFFKDADLPVEGLAYIVQFNAQSLAAAVKAANMAKLTEAIGNLQRDLRALYERNQNQITSHVAGLFSITDEQAGILLSNLSINAGKKLMAELEEPKLIEQNSDGSYKNPIDRATFGDIFRSYLIFHKSALLVTRMKISSRDVEWFIKNHNATTSLDFSSLPISAGGVNAFSKWLNLYKFLDFKSAFPEPETASIRSVLTLSQDATKTKDQIFDEIVKLTQWAKADLVSIDTGLQLYHPTNAVPAPQRDYADADVLYRVKKCYDRLKRLGVSASTIFGWVAKNGAIADDATRAAQTRQAAKSKYQQEDWLQKIGPLHDDIREKKRKALVEYHLEWSQRNEPETVRPFGPDIPNPRYWRDTNDLYKYFLIDVEMTSIQLTSRIKQAISSVQMFVQRCFLNLENRYVKVTAADREDTSSANAWSQWKWMKNYRIWEANRKVFFYPENWIEPELRDDKSPFFQDLENEIMQNEITKENVESAFVNYLQKLDEIAHLDVCGMYHQMENLTGDTSLYEINVVHVIGRTKAIPHIYYYRTYDMNYSQWSAWSKIDVEIAGDHVTPVVYNRKLHLFWLQFMEKPVKAKKVPAAKITDGPTDSPDPQKLLEIQLGWSIKKGEGWTPRKISKEKLIHPWERPEFAYNLKPYYKDVTNELYLDIYLSTTKEFNDGYFFDHYRNKTKSFQATATGKLLPPNPYYRTKTRFNQSFGPWHSSTFVFDGGLKEIQLKALPGQYYLPDDDEASDTNSYQYVRESFGEPGRRINLMEPHESGPRLNVPMGMHFQNTRLINNLEHSRNDNSLRLLDSGSSVTLLNGAKSPFELVISQQDLQMDVMENPRPMFYQDNQRAFFIKPEIQSLIDLNEDVTARYVKCRFMPFYHPYTLLFLRELNRDGIDGLLTRKIQTAPSSYRPTNTFSFVNSYRPTFSAAPDDTAKQDIVDFSFGGAYSIYNWEVFFHAPLLIACRLMENQKFEDAMNWFHYIFDPTSVDNYITPKRYWITRPFFEYNSEDYQQQRLESILSNLHTREHQDQLNAWRNNPFKPHLVARYRPVAYQKSVVIKYLDNLIAWGDMLFRRDTIESINEASLLYMLAYEILGRRPIKVPAVKGADKTYKELEPTLDDFGNSRVDVIIEDTLVPIAVIPAEPGTEPTPRIDTSYFCIPNNEFLTKYWDTVEDRLYKIRHSMNLEGIVRQLPLFEPPIDPALLVKAAAAGMDLSSVLDDLSAPVPHYRFRIVVQKAIEFANEVKQLGDKLLNVLEKRDAEQLSLMRSQHEILLLEAVKEVRKKQIREALATQESLEKSLEAVERRAEYYEGLISEGWLEKEKAAFGLSSLSAILDGAVAVGYILSGAFRLIPDFEVGANGACSTPEATATTGGKSVGSSAEMAVRANQSIAATLDKSANLLNILANNDRRAKEWEFQKGVADKEIQQVNKQILAAQIRHEIAEKEYDNHVMQIENSKTVDEYMRNKYTNQQLYSWMLTQISTTYFQAYQLAFDMAKKAEKCFQYELGIQTSSHIQFGYWDSLRKGLLSGDKLMTDLRKLEAAYINENRRELEITKHVSLAQMFPEKLLTLRETGACTISLPEWLFDMDYPGHYMRRIKNVSISIPCIVGPFTSVNCTLSLLRNEIRVDATGAYQKVDENDPRFRTMFGSISSIVTSTAQNDSGMFQLNFNDDRYLPFEGAGVISDWKIEMPHETNYFDFNSLSDAILHISYTSRLGGGLLNAGAVANLQAVLPNAASRLFSLKHEFSTAWNRFLYPENAGDQELIIELRPEHFQYFVRGRLMNLKIKSIGLFVNSKLPDAFTANVDVHAASVMINGNKDWSLTPDLAYANIQHRKVENLAINTLNNQGVIPLRIKLRVNANDFKSLLPGNIDDSFLLLDLGM